MQNNMITQFVKGALLIDMLAWSLTKRGGGGWLQMAGVRVAWNPNNPFGAQLISAEILHRLCGLRPLARACLASASLRTFLLQRRIGWPVDANRVNGCVQDRYQLVCRVRCCARVPIAGLTRLVYSVLEVTRTTRGTPSARPSTRTSCFR